MAGRLAAMALADVNAGRNPGSKGVYLKVVNDKKGVGPKSGWNHEVIPLPDNLTIPLSWRKPRRVFVNSMSDLFHEGVPFEYVDKVFAVMALTPHITYQILTKRPGRMAEYFNAENPLATRAEMVAEMHPRKLNGKPFTWGISRPDTRRADPYERRPFPEWPLPNVWLGTSCEDQQRAGERIPHLLRCPAAVRFLSCEPLLGPIDLTGKLLGGFHGKLTNPGESFPIYEGDMIPRVDWVIVGGESGPDARPCNVAWVRSIVEQCAAAAVPCFVKQLGARPLETETDDGPEWPVQLSYGNSGFAEPELRDKKGGDPDEWPADLRVRQFPAAPCAGAGAAPAVTRER